MNLIFISRAKYPFRGAAANRFLAYSKGLVEMGHHVTYLLILKQHTNSRKFKEDGIDFICALTPEDNNRKTGKLLKPFLYIRSIWNSKKIIKTIHRNRKIDGIILLTTLIRDLLVFIPLARSIKAKIIHERTEYPFSVIGGNKLTIKIRLFFYLYFILPRFDGIYVINNALKLYFSRITNSRVSVEVINMMVDTNRFKSTNNEPGYEFKYIAYCGWLSEKKDGVDILVEAFCRALISERIPKDIKLLLIGDNSDVSFSTKLNNIILQYRCTDNIIFTGRIEREIVPGILTRASVLALARPDNEQSKGGFPTKLGEYLATGKPVIITDVGEIGLFLKDGYNAFIAKPGDIDSFSDKIAEVFADYPRAVVIGKNGKLLAENEFNYREQARRLAYFIESL